MICICISVPILCLVAALLCGRYKRELFSELNKKEHPLLFLYPASARVLDLFRSRSSSQASSKLTSLMKQLYVRENVDRELYIYKVKKLSTIVGIICVICIVGALSFISSNSAKLVRSLARASFGGGRTSYTLDAQYNETSETVEIILDEEKKSEEEIKAAFEESYEGIIDEMLGENGSLNEVSKPLDLISSYGDISISWEISDTSLIDYRGELTEDIEENEYIPVDMYATLSIDEISQVYSIPVVITGESISAKELLIQNIYDSIEENNSAYDADVTLPDTINGQEIIFKNTSSDSNSALIFLAAIALFVIIVFYDRTLEDKVKKRRSEMMMDFSEIVFKLNLLYEAGLSIYRAWERIVTEYERDHKGGMHYAYLEMKLTLEQIKNGAPEAEAYGKFGKRCALHPYIKLGNILEQNLSKGTKGMQELLRKEASEAFEERKRTALKLGEEASTKMMIPMFIMLAIVMAIVAFPALMSFDL